MEPTSTQPVQTGAPKTNAAPVQKTDVLGIISIVFAFIGLQVIGLILGLIGVKKAKEEGRSTTLSKIGWILNLVFMIIAAIIIVLFLIIGAAASKNSDKIEDAASKLESSLEESNNSSDASASTLVAGYDKVTEGMTKSAAESALGTSSTSCTTSSYSGVGTYEVCSYGGFSDKVSITITYKDGVVQSKSKTNY